LLHSHPFGDPTAPQADIQMTKAIVDLVTPVGISVNGHIVASMNGHAGLRGLQFIPRRQRSIVD
jgi:DNA repair protein RadC